MSEKNRVEIHDFKDWKAGVYLIEAGCGQGKNYFVFNTLFPYAHENGKRMLVFSNRVALREQQQAQTQEKDVKLITYQSLEHDEYLETMQDTKNKVRGLMQQVSEYDYIVLDEAHYLYQDQVHLHQMILRKQDGVPEAPAQAKAIVRHRKILHQPQRRTLTLSPMETVKITTDTISLTRL